MSPHAAELRAQALLDVGRPEDAQRVAAEALASDPENLDLLVLLARCLVHSGQDQEAVELLDQASARSPQWAYPHRLRSVALNNLGQLEASLNAVRQALALDESDAWNHYRHAYALHNLSKTRPIASKAWAEERAGARAAANRAVELDLENPECHRLVAVVHDSAGERHIRSRAWQDAVRLDPEDSASLAQLAQDDVLRSFTSSGLSSLGRVLRVDPARAQQAESVVARALKKQIVLPLMLLLPAPIITLFAGLDATPAQGWGWRAAAGAFSAAALLLVGRLLLRLRSSLKEMFVKTLRVAWAGIAMVVFYGGLSLLWALTGLGFFPGSLIGVAVLSLALPLAFATLWLVWLLLRAVLATAFGLGLSLLPSRWLPGEAAWPVRKARKALPMARFRTASTASQQAEDPAALSGPTRWAVGLVLLLAVAASVPALIVWKSHEANAYRGPDYRAGDCAKAVSLGLDRDDVQKADCADPDAVLETASVSNEYVDCANKAYVRVTPGFGQKNSWKHPWTVCFAKNLREGSCYSWPQYGELPLLEGPARPAPCADREAHIRVEQRADGPSGPLACAAEQKSEYFPQPAPGVAYCLSDPNPFSSLLHGLMREDRKDPVQEGH